METANGTIIVDSKGNATIPPTYEQILAHYMGQDSSSMAWDILDPVKFNPLFTTL